MNGPVRPSGPPWVAVGARLRRFPWITTLGARPNLADYPPEHLALLRHAAKIYYPTQALAGQLVAAGREIFPSLACHLFAGDKIRQTRLLELLDLPHPRTRIFHGRQRAEILDHFSFPLVAKTPRASAQGRGVFLCRRREDLAAYLAGHQVAYIQEFLPGAQDLRVVVIGREPVCAYFRVPAPGEFRANLARGGRVEARGVPPEAVALAVRAAGLCGLDEVGVDLALCGGRVLILEFNVLYGHRGPRELGIDIPSYIAENIRAGRI